MSLKTCPKCGALITSQLDRCRQCKTYLHGTALEGQLLELLPAQFAGAPGTAVAVFIILGYYVLMMALAGPQNFIGFSPYTLQQLGALHGPSLLQGESWRYMTYLLGHHDLVHLAFNVSALTSAGPIVERLFDRKKMLLTYIAAGVVAGVASLVYYVYIRGGSHVPFVSAGASGAVCGMVGAALIGARRKGFEARDLFERMTRWALFMGFWGFAVPGINNAAHLGGFAAGAGLARVFRLGEEESVSTRRALSAAALAALGLIGVSVAFMVAHAKGFPVRLVADEHPRGIFGFTYYKGVDSDLSDQKKIWDDCINTGLMSEPPADIVHACELNLRVNAHDPRSYTQLAELLDARGDRERAATLRRIAAMMRRE